nr:hypothetical protein [Tanacetum cinerariifolium]
MAGLKENMQAVNRVTKAQGVVGGGLKAGSGHRRILGEINKNIINGPGAYGANSLQGTLSAQTGSKPSLPLPEGKKPKLQIISDETDDEDCSIIDAEDFNAPMFVQHTEAMLDEIDKMDEDVYEPLVDIDEADKDDPLSMLKHVDGPLEDIDEADRDDPLSVVEYVDEIYAHYRKQEISSCVSPGYMSIQTDITERMRGILIDWLVEVHYKFELMEETLYLTVNLIDRFLERQPIARKKLQLVGVTAMLLACKYEEISVPVVEDFIVISDKAYTRDEVLMMEKEMVNTLQFNISYPTVYVFIKRFLKAAESHKE